MKQSLQQFETAKQAALTLRPDEPIYCFRPQVLRADMEEFATWFPGKVAYAVKTNGEPMVLNTLVEAGVSAFDVASPAEIEAVKSITPTAELIYMHPIKAQSAIRRAFETHQIRVSVIDHEEELAKIVRIVGALDLDPGAITLFVRLQTKAMAAYELSRKFGAAPSYAAELLQKVTRFGFKAGLCFHVGSQVADNEAYHNALESVAWVRDKAGVPIHAMDIGGGFPAVYRGRYDEAEIPRLGELMERIKASIAHFKLDDLPLIAEPGRAIVARAFSLIVRVLLRKGRRLYINDGIWASLSDSWTGKISLPARYIADPAIRTRHGDSKSIVPFRICGATCDSVDILSRPFHLPETIETGDWIEVGHIGAYSLALRTRFNGFYPDHFVEVNEPFDTGAAPEGWASLEKRRSDELEPVDDA